MSAAAWTVAVLTLISIDALCIAFLMDRRRRCGETWFDHERFVNVALADRVGELTRPAAVAVIAHPCSFGGDLLEYPVVAGWDETSILSTLAQIEAL